MKVKSLYLLFLFCSITFACGETKGDKPKNDLGEKVFKRHCIACHGLDGKMQLNGSKDITASTLILEERVMLIKKGRKTMTPFESMLSEKEIKAVAEYTFKLK